MASRTPDPVETLLKAGPRRTALPEPAQRAQLRTDYGLSQAEVAEALGVARNTVAGWESGRSEPQGATRAAYAKLLDGMADQLAPQPEDVQPAQTAHTNQDPPARATAPQPAPAAPDISRRRPAEFDGPRARTAPQHTAPAPAARRHGARAKSAPRETTSAPADPRFADGPLAVLDGEGTAYGVGGIVLDCPASDLPALVEWALWEAKLGAPRLHRHGKDADPLIVLTARAAARLGLPPALEDRRSLRLSDDHPVVRGLARAKWQLTRRGFGPWARIYRPAQDGKRQCVQLAVLPWGALDNRAWGSADELEAAELAQILGDYATLVITPRGSAAVGGLELMTALRPPTRPVKDEAAGTWASGPNSGALTQAVDPAPPEAPDEHPVVTARYPRGHQRTAAEVLDEEAYEWIRDPELLTDSECAQQFAVGIDVNMAFAAAANRLTLGLGAPVHAKAPAFNKTVPGSWLVDLSHIDFDPRLPNPFTPHGARPEGPAWYATPTVAYAAELGHDIIPIEAYLRPESGPYLDAWYTRLRDAYMAVMERLGVVPGMSEADFLAAMEHRKDADPAQAAVLSAIKATVKGGIGKLRERPQGAGYRPGKRWPALERPTWRPDIRAAVISAARINMHRKMLKLAGGAGLFPIAVLSDCAVYLSDGPSPLDFLPRTPDGKPLPGGFRLGVSPGMVKHEGTQSMMWAAQMLDEGHNPARHIKGADAAAGGE
ncbi:telomere-associated protein Tap [Streptomyces sp. NPDC017993]|uniref:telomere-associated protein Tap n=1 Tax=Streptomyces sp. NPDC017993 TaxID=3365027 RepID=UPI0037A9B66F